MITKVVKIDKNTTKYKAELDFAASVIKDGGLVVFPTETVYGLGGDATNPNAAKKIYEAKGRPSDNPLIIHIATPADAEKYTYTTPLYYKLAERFMPGPLTVIMKARDVIPKETRASLPTVAVRCPENPIARELIKASGVPIAAPSANLSGSPSPTSAQHVIDDMLGRVEVIIDGGDADFGLESTIVKLDDDGGVTLLRPGKVTTEDLLSVCREVRIAKAVLDKLEEGEVALSPGMKYRHYAPAAPLFLYDSSIAQLAEFINKEKQGKKIAVLAYKSDLKLIKERTKGTFIYEFGNKNEELLCAHLLFSILRDADKRGFDEIYAPLPDKNGIGLALYNRMIRAAAHQILRL
jgi:L-threonylcarbamoyladenylate synthase